MKVISQRLIRVLPTRGPEIGRDTAGCSISQPSPPLLRVSLTLLPLRRRHPPFGSPCGPLPDRTFSLTSVPSVLPGVRPWRLDMLGAVACEWRGCICDRIWVCFLSDTYPNDLRLMYPNVRSHIRSRYLGISGK